MQLLSGTSINITIIIINNTQQWMIPIILSQNNGNVNDWK